MRLLKHKFSVSKVLLLDRASPIYFPPTSDNLQFFNDKFWILKIIMADKIKKTALGYLEHVYMRPEVNSEFKSV